MNPSDRAVVGLQVLGAVVSGIPGDRLSQAFSPALAVSPGVTLSYNTLETLRQAHWNHVHIGILP